MFLTRLFVTQVFLDLPLKKGIKILQENFQQICARREKSGETRFKVVFVSFSMC